MAATAEQRARGERLANLCVGCHSTAERFPLDGAKESMIPFGALTPPNLTPGGALKDWSDVMPAPEFRHMSDTDVESLVAFLRSQPAVAHETPATNISLMGTLLVDAGMFPTAVQPPITSPISPPQSGANADNGKYLVDISGCRSCHGANLTGGAPGGFGPEPGPSLALLVPQWTEPQFIATIRTGKDPYGHVRPPERMPQGLCVL
ncbi:MAG: hypothetical protein NTZ05_21245, partial [Chloroflexi bacterium]|nr:hypothetical protein [Chloroflexota bacterium]